MIIDEYTHGTYISKKRIWIRLEPVDGPAVQADVNKQNKDVGFARVKRRLMMTTIPTYTCYILYLHINLCIIYFGIPSNTSINDSFSSTPMSLLRILDIFCISVL